METIERDELKAALDARTGIKLVMAMHETHFEMAHIPGSVQLFAPEQAGQALGLAAQYMSPVMLAAHSMIVGC